MGLFPANVPILVGAQCTGLSRTDEKLLDGGAAAWKKGQLVGGKLLAA